MSRSGYSDGYDYDGDEWAIIRWRGAVKAALRGKRGQLFLMELVTALDALPEKKLISGELVCADGVCALGAVAQRRGIDVTDVDPYDHEMLCKIFGIAMAMACELMYQNDDLNEDWSPEERFRAVRAWAIRQLEVGIRTDSVP